MTEQRTTTTDPPADGERSNENFLRRWSRRKRIQTAPVEAAEPVPAVEHETPLTDADMPPIESLTAESDYSVFLAPGVSEELRRLALRKLFRLPQFNARCPLDGEYYDCTNLTPLAPITAERLRAAIEKVAQAGAALDRKDEIEKVAQAGAALDRKDESDTNATPVSDVSAQSRTEDDPP